jgi:hypothetical protein
LGDYSCTKLLRELESIASDTEEEGVGVDDDDEVMRIPEERVQGALPKERKGGLPDNLYVLPELDEEKDGSVDTQMQEAEVTKLEKKWGPVLVEKRFGRQQKDGRTMMEKSQERKRRVYLDGGKGNPKTYNPFSVLSNVEIAKVVSTVNVEIGRDVAEIMNSVAEIREVDASRDVNFRDSCKSCKEVNIGNDSGIGHCEGAEGFENVDSSTPTSKILSSLGDEETDLQGQ